MLTSWHRSELAQALQWDASYLQMQGDYEHPFLQFQNCSAHTDKHTGWYQPSGFLHGSIASGVSYVQVLIPSGGVCAHVWGLHLIKALHIHKIFIAIRRCWEGQRIAFSLTGLVIITGVFLIICTIFFFFWWGKRSNFI